jgi:hypothetical protein
MLKKFLELTETSLETYIQSPKLSSRTATFDELLISTNGDLGSHRVAWSENGVVIDSSPKLLFRACSFDT